MRTIRRVVVTGVGAVTPIGLDAESYWQALLAGQGGVGCITQFDASDFPVRIAAEVKGFEPERYMEYKTARRSGRFAQLGVAAARMALESASLTVNDATRDDIGVVMATSGALMMVGEQYRVLQERGPGRVDPLLVPRLGAHMGGVRVGHVLGVRGPNTTINSACASGADALGQALNMIRLGQAEVLVAGGCDAGINPITIAAMAVVGALSRNNDDPLRASRPFDAKRDGFVMGEGAGALILEAEEYARRRGAPILCEVAGAVEAVAAALTIRDNMLPPTINYETPDPECDLDYVPNQARPHRVDAVISNSFGMGGQNACLVLRRYEG